MLRKATCSYMCVSKHHTRKLHAQQMSIFKREKVGLGVTVEWESIASEERVVVRFS